MGTLWRFPGQHAGDVLTSLVDAMRAFEPKDDIDMLSTGWMPNRPVNK
jgi:hypothetical protein